MCQHAALGDAVYGRFIFVNDYNSHTGLIGSDLIGIDTNKLATDGREPLIGESPEFFLCVIQRHLWRRYWPVSFSSGQLFDTLSLACRRQLH